MHFSDTLTTIVRQTLEAGVTPALIGEPGIGKSSFVEALAYHMNTEAFVLPCNQLADKADLTGARLVQTEDKSSYTQVFYPHHVITDCIAYAKEHPDENPILFLDEINRTTSDVTSGVLTLVTMRRMGHISLPKNVRIIVAGNDRGNVTSLDDASVSRFAIFHVEPDAQSLIAIMGSTLHPWVVDVLTENPNLVFSKPLPDYVSPEDSDDSDNDNALAWDAFDDGSDQMQQFTTPRTLTQLSQWLSQTTDTQLRDLLATPVSVNDTNTSLLSEVVTSFVGDTAFSALFMKVASEKIAGGSTTSSAVTVPRPSCFDRLLRATDVKDLENMIAGLSHTDVSGSIVYAIQDNRDHDRIIEHLAIAHPTMEPDHMRTLFDLAGRGAVNSHNLETFIQLSTPLSQSLKPSLAVYV